MSAWPSLARSDVLLLMNEAPAHRRQDRRREGRRRARRRDLEQRLSRATAQIELTDEYQASLERVMELGNEFQRALDEAQRERWLLLEEALLEHASRLHRAYFEAGVKLGERSCFAGQKAARADVVATLARLIVELVRR